MIASEPVISIRLAIPDIALGAPLFPGNNRWATRLLCRLLRNRIGAAGVTVKDADYAFPFNNSFYLFTVVERPAGLTLAAVREEIGEVGVSAWAQIAWRDQDELIWRLYYPESGIFAAPSQAEFEAESRFVSEMQDAVQKLQQRDEPSGQ